MRRGLRIFWIILLGSEILEDIRLRSERNIPNFELFRNILRITYEQLHPLPPMHLPLVDFSLIIYQFF